MTSMEQATDHLLSCQHQPLTYIRPAHGGAMFQISWDWVAGDGVAMLQTSRGLLRTFCHVKLQCLVSHPPMIAEELNQTQQTLWTSPGQPMCLRKAEYVQWDLARRMAGKRLLFWSSSAKLQDRRNCAKSSSSTADRSPVVGPSRPLQVSSHDFRKARAPMAEGLCFLMWRLFSTSGPCHNGSQQNEPNVKLAT